MSDDRRQHRERGQALVEFALVLPVLGILILGIVQLGLVFHDYVALTDAVRTGARQAAITHSVGTATSAVVNSASDLKASGLQVTVSSSFQPGDDVTVTATYPYAINVLGVVVKSGRLSAKTVDRVE
jgi:Flp pilus assembly protein TadG